MISRLLVLALVAASLTACKVTPDPTPQIKMADINIPMPKFDDDALAKIMTCDKVQANVSADQEKSAVQVRGTTDLQDVEKVDCNGKKTLEPKAAKDNFSANLTLNPPAGLKDVTFIDVQNTRTCADRRLYIKNATAPTDAAWSGHPYWSDETGHVVIGLTDSHIVFQVGLNVANGQNLMTVIYYGRCLDEKPDATGYCQKGEELARQTVLVQADIEKRELNGVETVNTCSSAKK